MERIGLGKKTVDLIKKYRYALLVLLLGICLMLLPTGAKENNAQTQPTTQPSLQTDISEQLSEILSQIQGAGKVQVMLTVAQGEKNVYQTDGQEGTDKFSTVIITDENRGQHGLLQQVNPPVYLGAIVVCQGADRASVKLKLIQAVSSLTGLSSDHITVVKMQGD